MDEDITELLSRHRKGDVTALLQEVQERYGYLPAAVLERLAEASGLPLSEFYSVATFYSQFRLERPGRHRVQVCHGTACHINGAAPLTEALERELGVATGRTRPDGEVSLEAVACLGCCSLAPVVTVDGEVFGKMDREAVRRLVRRLGTGFG